MIIVDRILNNLAVCVKDGSIINIPLSEIAGSVSEGDIVLWDENNSKYTVDTNGTGERFKSLSERFSRIKNRKRKGNDTGGFPAQ